MNSNKAKCIEVLNTLKTRLSNNYDVIMTDEDLLCKTGKIIKPIINTNTNNNLNTAYPTVKICPIDNKAIIDWGTCNCNCHSTCNSANTTNCPLNKVNKQPTSIHPVPNKLNKSNECLFRLRPTDINNGIAMHVIILHGEVCELKMTFEAGEKGAVQIVEVINFLVR